MDLQSIFNSVLNMSMTGSVVILVVLLCRLLLRRAPKVFSYGLWLVVLFRLICPVSISSALSLFNLSKLAVPEPMGVVTAVKHTLVEDVYGFSEDTTAGLPDLAIQVDREASAPSVELVPEPVKPRLQLLDYAAYAWLLGIGLMLVHSLYSYRKLGGHIAGAVRLRENIYLADGIPSPFVLGVIRPRIYLPSTLEAGEQPYIIAHEQYHIRRKDYLLKLLAYGALCIHWFNPLVWVAFVLCGRDMEMSCDEAVIRKLGADIRADYSQSLLRLATGHRYIAGTPLAFGEGDTKGRVRNMAKWKKPKAWVILCAAVACIAVLAACGMNPAESGKEVPPVATEEPEELTQWIQGLDLENLSSNSMVGIHSYDSYYERRCFFFSKYPTEELENFLSLLKQIPENEISLQVSRKSESIRHLRESSQTYVVFDDEVNEKTVVVRNYLGNPQICLIGRQDWDSRAESTNYAIWNVDNEALLQFLNDVDENPQEVLPLWNRTVDPADQSVSDGEGSNISLHTAADVAGWLRGLAIENLSSTAQYLHPDDFYFADRVFSSDEIQIKSIESLLTILREIPEEAITRAEKATPMTVLRLLNTAQCGVIFNDEVNARTVLVRLYSGKAQVCVCELRGWMFEIELKDFSIWDMADDTLLQYLNTLLESPDQFLPVSSQYSPMDVSRLNEFTDALYAEPVYSAMVGNAQVNTFSTGFPLTRDVVEKLVEEHPDAAVINIYNWQGYTTGTSQDIEVASLPQGGTKKISEKDYPGSDKISMGYGMRIKTLAGPEEDSSCNSRTYWTRFFRIDGETRNRQPLEPEELVQWYGKCEGFIEYSTDYQTS